MNSSVACVRRLLADAARARTAQRYSTALRRAYATPARYEPKQVEGERDPQLGDYPHLPDVSRQTLPPLGWWDTQMRRNFGDTVRLLSSFLSIHY